MFDKESTTICEHIPWGGRGVLGPQNDPGTSLSKNSRFWKKILTSDAKSLSLVQLLLKISTLIVINFPKNYPKVCKMPFLDPPLRVQNIKKKKHFGGAFVVTKCMGVQWRQYMHRTKAPDILQGV